MKVLTDTGLVTFWNKIKSYVSGSTFNANQIKLSSSKTVQAFCDETNTHLSTTDSEITNAKSRLDGHDTFNAQQIQKNTQLDTNMANLNTRDDQIDKAIKSIAATGGASTADAVTYDKSNSGLVAATVQGAVDEVNNKTLCQKQHSPYLNKTGYYLDKNGKENSNTNFEIKFYKLEANAKYNLHISLVGGNAVGFYCDKTGTNFNTMIGEYDGTPMEVKTFDGAIATTKETYIALNSVINDDTYYCEVLKLVPMTRAIEEKLDKETNVDMELATSSVLTDKIIRSNGSIEDLGNFKIKIYKLLANRKYNISVNFPGNNVVGFYCNETGTVMKESLGDYGGTSDVVRNFDKEIVPSEDTYIALNTVYAYQEYHCVVSVAAYVDEVLNNLIESGGGKSSKVYCLGDSLTQGAQEGSDVTFPFMLAQLLGSTYSVTNLGSGGDRTLEIGARAGNIPMICEPFTMPASGEVSIKLKTSEPDFLVENFAPGRQNDSSFLNPYVINGVEGNLRHSGNFSSSSADHKYYFKRINDGNVISIDRPQLVMPKNMLGENDICVFWTGTNDGYNIYESGFGLENFVKLVKLLIGQHKKFVIIGNYAIEDSFMTKENLVMCNNSLRLEFGKHYIDLYNYLLNYGLSDAGLTPTDTDISYIKEGKVPKSLLVDGLHLKKAGYNIVANLVYKRLKLLKYI